MSDILVTVDEQNLHIADAPKVAAQGVNENYIVFTFSPDWDGFGKSALFYREEDEDTVYESVVDANGRALVPHEVTDQDGKICFGVCGVKNDVILTSEILKYKVVKGLYTSGQESEPPTPGIYEQMLTLAGIMEGQYADLRVDLDNEITTRSGVMSNEITERMTADSDLREALASEISNRTTADEVLSARMDTFASLPRGSTAGNAELLDIRVGNDGKTYPTAGDAVRGQISSIDNKVYSVGKIEVGSFSGYLQADGLVHPPTSALEVGTEYIPTREGETLELKVNLSESQTISKGYYAFRYSDGSYERFTLASQTGQILSWEITVPTNAVAIAFSFPSYGVATSYEVYRWREIGTIAEIVPILEIESKIPFTFSDGYYNSDGSIHDPTDTQLEKYTNKVKVNGGDKIYLDFRLGEILKYNTSPTQLSWCAYSQFKKNGSVTRTNFPIPEASPSRTNRKYAVITLDNDTEYFAFSFRTYGYTFSVDAYYLIDNVDLGRRLSGIDNMQSELNRYIIEPNIINDNPYTRISSTGEISSTTSKIGTSNFYKVNEGDTLHYKLSGLTGYAILATYDKDKNFINSVLASGYLDYIEGDYTFSSTEKYIRVGGVLAYINDYSLIYNNGPVKLEALREELQADVELLEGEIGRAGRIGNPFSPNPYYSHTLIEKIRGDNVIIPSESIWNIQMDHRLGFTHVEGNAHVTSDGKYVVMHGSSNAFGNQVEHVDGVTDIGSIKFDAVTLDWIKQNVRYKSIYPKYRVAPPSLEEWLLECKRNGMIPVVTSTTQALTDAISAIMGKDNFIAYNAARRFTNGMIMAYTSRLSTKEDILDYCNKVQPPFMLCIGNSKAFTDAEIAEIAEAVHAEGYLIGVAGCYTGEAEWQRVYKNGFDFSASGWNIPDIKSGNLCNLAAGVDFTDFETTGTVSNGELALATGQTIKPALTLPTSFLSGGSLRITYTGSIKVTMGNNISQTYESDGSQSQWFSTYFLNAAPTFIIEAMAETIISDIAYKASKM